MVSPAGFPLQGRPAAPAAALPAGTGPFQFAPGASASDQSLVLLRNEGYHWGPAGYRHRGPVYVGSGYDTSGSCRYADRTQDHTGPALLERIELRFEEDPARRAQALESGEVDAAEDLPAAGADRLERSGRFWVFTVPIPASGDMRGDANALAVRRIDITRLSASDILAATPSAPVHLNGARKEINCLSYGVQGWDPGFYETSVRAIP